MKWIELAGNLGFFGIIASLITYLLNCFLNRKTEAYKSELQADLESHKSTLNLFNARDSKVFSKRMDVIEEVYKLLVNIDSTMKILTRKIHIINGDGKAEEQERANNAQQALYSMINYYLPKKIYFSKDLSTKIDEIIQVYREANLKYHAKDRMISMGASLPYEEIKKNYEIAYKKVYEECELIKEQLEKEFRTIYQLNK